ncbi:MAG TPA: hypothetical protein VGW40_01965 [Allosphingosinicella sp.]|nr:hypothetical protein [Allosphingosinicella sp.]
MIRLWFALVLALAAPAAFAQPPEAAPGLWTRADGRIGFTAARISLALRAGAVEFRRTAEFSHQGEGLDSALQYWSDDRQVFATVYVYYPGLAHAGLTAFATDNAIQVQSGRNLRTLRSRLVAAGGREGMAIRADYAGFRDGMASSAAFIKAGRWIVKLRVSGPEARRAEVEGAMTALLDGLRFEGEIVPRPPAPLEVADCPAPSTARAGRRRDNEDDAPAELLVGTMDGAGNEARREPEGRTEVLPPRFGSRWCLSTRARIGDSVVPILRVDPGRPAETAIEGRSVVVAILSDSGTVIEIVEALTPRRFIMLYHEIGGVSLLGAYDAPPSDEQIADIVSGADREGQRIRASARLRPNGNTEMEVPPPRAPAATPQT